MDLLSTQEAAEDLERIADYLFEYTDRAEADKHRPGDGNGCRGTLHLIAPAVGLSTRVGPAYRLARSSAAPLNVLTCVRFCRQRAF